MSDWETREHGKGYFQIANVDGATFDIPQRNLTLRFRKGGIVCYIEEMDGANLKYRDLIWSPSDVIQG